MRRHERLGRVLATAASLSIIGLTAVVGQEQAPGTVRRDVTVEVSGIVRTADGEIVSGAVVEFATQDPPTTTTSPTVTDASGSYSLQARPHSSVRVKARVANHAVTVSPEKELDDRSISIDLTLNRGVALSGRVVDERGAPMPGATVTMSMRTPIRPDPWATTGLEEVPTGADGWFRFAAAPREEVLLRAGKAGYAESRQQTVSLLPGPVTSGIELVVRDAHVVAGCVIDETGRSVAKAKVTARLQNNAEKLHRDTQTTDGHYRFEYLPGGQYSMWAQSGRRSGSHFSVDAGREDANVTVTLRNRTVVGLVVDDATSRPIREFTVSTDLDLALEKDESVPDRFLVKHFHGGGGQRVILAAKGYVTQSVELPMISKEGQTVERTYRLGRGGSIIGRLVHAATSEPLSGARVILHVAGEPWQRRQPDPAATILTDKHGRFRFDRVEPGTSGMAVRPDPPLLGRDLKATVAHGTIADMGDIRLGTGGNIRGRVIRLPADEPVPATKVQVRLQDQLNARGVRETTTDETGSFHFSALSAGKHTVWSPKGASSTVTVADGETTEVVLQIGNAGLKGVVMVEEKPLPGADVCLYPASGQMRHVESDADGRFLFEDVPAGKAKVSMSLGPTLGAQHPVELVAGETVERVFYVDTGHLHGRVEDSQGKPLPGTTITLRLKRDAGIWETERRALSLDTGGFSAIKLPTGDYQAAAECAGYQPAEPVAFSVVKGTGPKEAVVFTLVPLAH